MPKDKELTFCLHRTDGLSNWSYELSNDSVLKETENTRYIYLGHAYDDWKFEPIGSGEVTIYFTAQYETEIVEEDCFSITYYVDENYRVTEISSENKPSVVNFDNNIEGLIWLKVFDSLQRNIINFFVLLLG